WEVVVHRTLRSACDFKNFGSAHRVVTALLKKLGSGTQNAVARVHDLPSTIRTLNVAFARAIVFSPLLTSASQNPTEPPARITRGSINTASPIFALPT